MKHLAIGLLAVLLWGVMAAGAQETGACASVERGVIERTLISGGVERSYLLYIPETYEQPAPLVLSMHGFASNPRQQMEFSDWNTVADEHGFIVVYPQGTGFPLRWNTDQTPDDDENDLLSSPMDDVAFISDLIDHLAEDYCLDQARVYATGLSNGGGMSNRLACELADRITAIGTVAGAYSPLDAACDPSRPVPVIAFHGTEDTIVPYEGVNFRGSNFPPITSWAAAWAERNGCDPAPEVLDSVGDVDIISYTNCDEDVQVILHTVNGGGHNWPGGGDQPELFMGHVNRDVNASERMWAFFEGYSLPN